MKNNDFVIIFQSLKPNEKKDFEQYIRHFYKDRKKIITIFEQVAGYLQTPDAATSSHKEKKNRLNALSDLKKWACDFLIIQQVHSNSYDAQFLLLEALRKRGLTELLDQKTEQLSKELKEHPNPDMPIKLLTLRLADAEYFTIHVDKLENLKEQMQGLMDLLDNLYISTKLTYSSETQSRKNVRQEDSNSRLLNDIVALAETDTSLHPSIKSFYLPLFKLIKDESVVAYSALKTLFINGHVTDSREKLATLLYLLNFSASCAAQGDDTYYQEYFDVAQIGLHQSLFTATGQFPTTTFINIGNAGCRIKKYQWTKEFITHWSPFLKPDDRLLAYNFASARVYFEEHNFKAVIDLLSEIVDATHTQYEVQIRILLARAYYEKKELKWLTSYCKSSGLYVWRSTAINTHLKENIANFFKILAFLANNKPKKQILKELEKKKDALYLYDWLKQKIDCLES